MQVCGGELGKAGETFRQLSDSIREGGALVGRVGFKKLEEQTRGLAKHLLALQHATTVGIGCRVAGDTRLAPLYLLLVWRWGRALELRKQRRCGGMERLLRSSRVIFHF